MKDKLYKNNHKGIYYHFRTFLLSFVVFSGLLTAIFIPTYISVSRTSKTARAESENETEKSEVVDNENNDQDEINSLLAYE